MDLYATLRLQDERKSGGNAVARGDGRGARHYCIEHNMHSTRPTSSSQEAGCELRADQLPAGWRRDVSKSKWRGPGHFPAAK